MAMRTLVCDGVEWTVWDVVRSLQGLTTLPVPESASAAWLCFESRYEKRRLNPAPEGWGTWPEDRLVEALRSAEVVSPVSAKPRATRMSPAVESERARDVRFEGMLQRVRAFDERVRLSIEQRASPEERAMDEPLPLPEQ
jgi:hypothetical protein